MRTGKLRVATVLLCGLALGLVGCGGQGDSDPDADCKSLIYNAMAAIEAAYATTGTFDPTVLTPEVLKGVEPSISFRGTGSRKAAFSPVSSADRHKVDYSGTSSYYAIGALSESRKTFGVIVDKGSDGGSTFYINGRPWNWSDSDSVGPRGSFESLTSATHIAEMSWGEAVVGDTSGVSLTVEAPVEASELNKKMKASAKGESFWYCTITLTNNGTQSFSCDRFDFTFVDSQDAAAESIAYMDVGQPQLKDGTAVRPGVTLTGVVLTRITAGRTISYVDYHQLSKVLATWR